MNLVIKIIQETLVVFSKLFLAVLPSILVLIVLTTPVLPFVSGSSISIQSSSRPPIHELFPNATWNDLEPCGIHFDEQKEFEKALQCVNNNVWRDTPLEKPEQTHIPRCFIVKANSSDVFTRPDIGFNFLPFFWFSFSGLEIGAVVGVYQPETRTVFVVENVDAAMVYRHELQHYFLHMHDPETQGGGHDQEIWHKCEPPYYTPSDKVKPVSSAYPHVLNIRPVEPNNTPE